MKKIKEIENLTIINDKELDKLNVNYDCIILNTAFSIEDFGKNSLVNGSEEFLVKTNELIEKAVSKLNDGGLIFIYGLPNYLSFLGEYVSNIKDNYSYLFKYWISCEFSIQKPENNLPSSHIGLLMYLKTKSKKNTTPFELNTKFERIPYTFCPSCGNYTKDWGGKKHLRNPLGSAISDVWSFPKTKINKNFPDEVLDRIIRLLPQQKNILLLNQTTTKFEINENNFPILNGNSLTHSNEVIEGSCIDYLDNLSNQFPDGVFDLVFADPPYNLSKNYSTYDDDLEDKKYIDWCNQWLEGMYKNLKPGGTLLVLNIPKWSIHHFTFLSPKMIFKNWIVWDALSTPAGKLLPAHYSLICFTKPGNKNTINYDIENDIDLRDYCLRGSCVKNRKKNGNNLKEALSDIWKDVHRIKHKKDRDQHPCQLPTKLMERIINIFSNEGDLVFDPFGGAGTTAIAAKKLKRNYIITELDKHYVEIAKNNLNKVELDEAGNYVYIREGISNEKVKGVSKKVVENTYLELCEEKGKSFTLSELENDFPEIFNLVSQYSGDKKKLVSIAKRKLEAKNQLIGLTK